MKLNITGNPKYSLMESGKFLALVMFAVAVSMQVVYAENFPNGQSPSGSISVNINPAQPKINEQVTMTFIVPNDGDITGLKLTLQYPDSAPREPNIQWNIFGCPPNCVYTFMPQLAGTYQYDVRTVSGT